MGWTQRYFGLILLLAGCATLNHPLPYHAPVVIKCPNQATAYYSMLDEWMRNSGTMLDCGGLSMPIASGYGFAQSKPFEKVEIGDVVVFKNRTGQTAHVVIGISDKGVMTKGINNAIPDDGLITKQNYVGVLTKVWTY